jgi:hypothetical protein
MTRQVTPGWLDPYILGRYLAGVANDDLNGMEVVASCRLATSSACVARRRIVGLLGTVAIHHEWAPGWRYTIVANRSALSCYGPTDPLPTCLLSI